MKDISRYIIKCNVSILEGLEALNNLSSAPLALFVIAGSGEMRGTVTDGDLRRYLISGGKLDDLLEKAMHLDFLYLNEGELDLVKKVHYLKKKGIGLIPVLDSRKYIVKIYNLRDYRSMLPVDAILMAGGKGERLRPLTENTPKPLLPVGNKAIIDYNIDRLISFGIEHIGVTVNYLKEQIEEHFIQPRKGVKITCIREPKYLGTIGSVQFVEKFYNDTILVMNSDLFTDVDYEAFYLCFKENDADMAIAVIPYSVSVPYGIFEMEGQDILGLREKPTYNYYANGGIYLVKKQLLEMIPDNAYYDATDFVELLISQNRKVIYFPITGYWLDIGKHEEYKKAQEMAKYVMIKDYD